MTDLKDQELDTLRARIQALEAQIRELGHEPVSSKDEILDSADGPPTEPHMLRLDEYTRYGRQMILPGFGLPCE